MTPKNYHETFEKTSGTLALKSYGGGSPRFLRVSEGYNAMSLSVEQARDLHYMLGRFIDRHGEE